MSGGRSWTTGEARRLYELRKQNVRMADIARLLGRTQDSLYSFLSYVPATPESCAHKKAIERAIRLPKPDPSERLRVATLMAIAAYANDNRLHIDAAANRLLYARH